MGSLEGSYLKQFEQSSSPNELQDFLMTICSSFFDKVFENSFLSAFLLPFILPSFCGHEFVVIVPTR